MQERRIANLLTDYGRRIKDLELAPQARYTSFMVNGEPVSLPDLAGKVNDATNVANEASDTADAVKDHVEKVEGMLDEVAADIQDVVDEAARVTTELIENHTGTIDKAIQDALDEFEASLPVDPGSVFGTRWLDFDLMYELSLEAAANEDEEAYEAYAAALFAAADKDNSVTMVVQKYGAVFGLEPGTWLIRWFLDDGHIEVIALLSPDGGPPGKDGKDGKDGEDGAQGNPGNPGSPGANAPTITAIKEQHYLSTSQTTQTGGTWQDTMPTWVAGRYYWVRLHVTYSDGTVYTSAAYLDLTSNRVQAAVDVGTAAQLAAENAQTSANGKNKVNYGTSAPTSSTAGRPGDLFFVRNANEVLGQYLCTAGSGSTSGNTWAAQTLRSEVIATLDVGKLTGGTIAAERLVGAAITGGMFTLAANGVIQTDVNANEGAKLTNAGFAFYDNNVQTALLAKNGTFTLKGGTGALACGEDANNRVIITKDGITARKNGVVTASITSDGGVFTGGMFQSDIGNVGTKMFYDGFFAYDTDVSPYTVVGSANGSTTSIGTLFAHQPGDVLILLARTTSSSFPTKPAASATVPDWQPIPGTQVSGSANLACYWAQATSSSHISGSWTGASGVLCVVLRNSKSAAVPGFNAAVSITTSSTATTSSWAELPRMGGSALILAVASKQTTSTATVPTAFAAIAAPANMAAGQYTGTGIMPATTTVSSGIARTVRIEIMPSVLSVAIPRNGAPIFRDSVTTGGTVTGAIFQSGFDVPNNGGLKFSAGGQFDAYVAADPRIGVDAWRCGTTVTNGCGNFVHTPRAASGNTTTCSVCHTVPPGWTAIPGGISGTYYFCKICNTCYATATQNGSAACGRRFATLTSTSSCNGTRTATTTSAATPLYGHAVDLGTKDMRVNCNLRAKDLDVMDGTYFRGPVNVTPSSVNQSKFTFAASANVSNVDVVNCLRWGPVMQFQMNFRLTAARPAGSTGSTSLGTLPAQFRPMEGSSPTWLHDAGTAQGFIRDNGEVVLNYNPRALTTSDTIAAKCFFFLSPTSF